MSEVIANWDPEFIVSLFQNQVIPGIGSGFVLMVAFYLVGLLVNAMFDAMKGSFYWK